MNNGTVLPSPSHKTANRRSENLRVKGNGATSPHYLPFFNDSGSGGDL
jgi:hypothetical protein